MAPAETPTPLVEARQNLGAVTFYDQTGRMHRLDQFLTTSETDCFAVMKDGRLVYDWF